MKKKIVIVGGVAGGATAATRLKRLDREYEVIVFDKGKYISFGNCGMPYYIGGVTKEEDIYIYTPQDLKDIYGVEVYTETMVTEVNNKENKVVVKDKKGEIREETYDYLIVSPGGYPFMPPTPGIDHPNIRQLRNPEDMLKIKAKVDKASDVAVIGGGFIGIEVAENVVIRNIKTHLIQAGPNILAFLDKDMAMEAEDILRCDNIDLILNDFVVEFKHKNNKVELILKSGKTITVDFVVTAIGVRPDTQFLESSDIALNERKYIQTDKFMRTSVKNIFALGDAVETYNIIDGEKTTLALAGPANKQSRVAADTIHHEINSNAKPPREYEGVQYSSVLKLFEHTIAATGFNEFVLNSKNIPYYFVDFYAATHAGYYPESKEAHIKVYFHQETAEILGAQCISEEYADKYMDVFATMMRYKGTIYDAQKLELLYSPPYGGPRSPENVFGFLAESIIDSKHLFATNEQIKTAEKNPGEFCF